MKIQNDCYVSIDYRLNNDEGLLLDSSQPDTPLRFIVGRGQMVAGLEKGLLGLSEADQATIVVEPEEGYGPIREDLVRQMPKEVFPADIDLVPGTHLRASGPYGPLTLTIKAVEQDSVTIDLNHPLAGKRLHFFVTVLDVREATAQEIEEIVACQHHEGGACDGSCEL